MGAAACQLQSDRGIATMTLDETDEVAVRRHSRAAAKRAWVETRVRSEDFARWKNRRPAASAVGIVVAAAAGDVPAAAHCWDRMGGSCSATRRNRTDAAESGTGRCMAERPS